MSLKPDPASIRKLGILAGAGALPREVAEACLAQGTAVFIVDLEGAASEWAGAFAHQRVSLGQVGHVLDLLREQGCDAVTMAGGLVRPSLKKTRFDFKGLTLLPKLVLLFGKGDDELLSGVADLFAKNGFPVIGPENFIPDSLARSGSIAGAVPDLNEIAYGCAILDALSPFDIGQAAVVSGARCLAVEAAEGTAAMLVRVADMRAQGRIEKAAGGLLVKLPKREQDSRVDRPAIGPDTVRAAAKAGLTGIAVQAGGVIVLESGRTERIASETGLSLYGFER